MSKHHIYMILFLIFFTAWSLVQIKFFPIFYGRGVYHSSAAYITLSCVPILVLMYVVEKNNSFDNKIIRGVILVLHTTFILVHGLNYLKIYEYAESVILTQISLIIAFVCLVVFYIKNYLNNIKNKNIREIGLVDKGVLMMAIMGVLDLINAFVRIFNDYSIFSRYGLLVLAICMFVEMLKTSIYYAKMSTLSEVNQRNALTDALTGLGNRRAFDKKIEDIKRIPTEKQNFAVLMFDVNNLKKVNDELGHTMGDSLIMESARIIDRSCMNEGLAFRYGGDEFIVLIYDNAKEKLDRAIKNFNEIMKDYNNRTGMVLYISIACGYELHLEDDTRTIEEIIKVADENMYENKREMKRGQKSYR